MAVYVGGTKCNIFLDGIMYDMELYASIPIIDGVRLLSSDNYILKDSNGLYLIAIKGSE